MLKILPIVFAVLSLGQATSVAQQHRGKATVVYCYGGTGAKTDAALKRIEAKLEMVQKQIKVLQSGGKLQCKKVPKNCVELLKCGIKTSGVYTVNPDGRGNFKVYCDQKTSGGGWAVFQRRQDGSVDFYRGWSDYKRGFGNLKGELWLGLDNINRLTHQARNRLRVELMDTKGKAAYAEYDYFAVSSERNKYRLSLGTYSGTAGDSLKYHRGAPFTTKDRDNDSWSSSSHSGNCAVFHKGAWWYKACAHSSLNGLYHHGHSSTVDGVIWYHWKGDNYSAKRAEMKIRPVSFKAQ